MKITNHWIFDLDGTLFDDRHRLPLIDKNLPGEMAYSDYHAKMHADPVFKDVETCVINAYRAADVIEFWTARPERVRKETVKQIALNFLGFDPTGNWYSLSMRVSGAARHDGKPMTSPEVKSEWLRELLKKNGALDIPNVINIVEDRADVLRAYDYEINQFLLTADQSKNFEFNLYLVKDGTFIGRQRIYLLEGDIGTNRDFKPQGISFAIDIGNGNCRCTTTPVIETAPMSAADILDAMANTYRARNAEYKDNYKVVGKVMAALFPNGIELTTEEDHNFYHLFELIIVKLTRFTNSGLTHKDSLHDMAIYSAMCESLVDFHKIKIK